MTTAQYSIACGAAASFENVWQITKELLTQVNGFLRLDFQKGPEKDGKTTCFILTMWESEQNYLSWRGCDLNILSKFLSGSVLRVRRGRERQAANVDSRSSESLLNVHRKMLFGLCPRRIILFTVKRLLKKARSLKAPGSFL